MPSVLIELGYITNPNEEAYLLSEQGSSALAKSIYQAFLNYKQHSRKSATAVSPVSEPEEDIETPESEPQQTNIESMQSPSPVASKPSEKNTTATSKKTETEQAGIQNSDTYFRQNTSCTKQIIQRTVACKPL